MPAPYVLEVANAIREATGDHDARNDALYLVYAVLALTKGDAVTPSDVHDAWCALGAHDPSDADNMVPFRELPEAVKRRDDPFATAIRTVSRSLRLGASVDHGFE